MQTKKQHSKKEIARWRADFAASLRRDKEGRFCMPGAAYATAMLQASECDGKRLFALKCTFHIAQALLPIENSKPMLHRRRLGKSSGLVAACACFPNMHKPKKPWRVAIPIAYDASQISSEELLGLLEAAGESVGVGAWRPALGGQMGRFKIHKIGPDQSTGEEGWNPLFTLPSLEARQILVTVEGVGKGYLSNAFSADFSLR